MAANKTEGLSVNERSERTTLFHETEEIKLVNQSTLLGKVIDVYGSAETPYFLAKDVAEWIEHSNVSDMVGRIDEEEVTKFNLGSRQGVCNFLSEDGLYEVLMLSRKPIAKQFKKGIKEILKSIRKTGEYQAKRNMSPLEIQEEMLKALQLQLRETIETKQKLEQLKEEVDDLRQRTTTSLDRSTIVAYISRNNIKLDISRFGAIGRKASSICRRRGIEYSKIHDVRWGMVNVYPDTVLDELFGMEGLCHE